ncbi:MAG: PCRF domain-containing protein, partial [Gemmatimonadetes bacterium]|nr:PCRF domain-containing protein [Gemmatimonadota bacterium]
MAAPGFWDDAGAARSAVDQLRQLKRWTDPFANLERRVQDAHELADLLTDDPDPELQEGLEEELPDLFAALEDLELQNMLQGPDDQRAALVTIRPGAGGTESQDWAQMLMRMYTRWAERR